MSRIVLIERIGIVLGMALMVAAVALIEWHAGLLFAGFLLTAVSSDFRIGRRP